MAGKMPAGDPIPPSIRKELDFLRNMISDLYNRPQQQPQKDPRDREIVFSHQMPVTGTRSAPYALRDFEGFLQRVDVACTTGPSNKTVFGVYLNGVEVTDVTVAAGDDQGITDDDMIEVEEGDTIAVQMKSGGTGIEGVTVRVLVGI